MDDRIRVRQLDLAGRLARCCRNIDDVLFLNMSKGEVEYSIQKMYDPANTSLELSCECATWVGDGSIHYLDMSLMKDGRGEYMTVYDKRTALAREGLMGEVRRFPHALSKLAEVCRYGVLTSFLHALHARVMRKGEFARYAVERVMDMRRNGYSLQKLMNKLMSFVRHHLHPARARVGMQRRLRGDIARALVVESERAKEQWARGTIVRVLRRWLPGLRTRIDRRRAALAAAQRKAALKTLKARATLQKRMSQLAAKAAAAAERRKEAVAAAQRAARLISFEVHRRELIQRSEADWHNALVQVHTDRFTHAFSEHLLAARQHTSRVLQGLEVLQQCQSVQMQTPWQHLPIQMPRQHQRPSQPRKRKGDFQVDGSRRISAHTESNSARV